MSNYPFNLIEPKWQRYWEERRTFCVTEDKSKEKRYILDMFPYPSAQGLHVGHPEGYTATDIYCRYLRMKGYNVLHPMGFDSFGLPAENYAIKTGTHPKITTESNIEHFTKQIKALGFSYDWERKVSTCDSDYYRWTQWIFLQLYKKGLAYESYMPINWCPSCKTGLANEEVKEGHCERCGAEVTHKTVRQWVLKITDYAERLLKDLDTLDWPESVKTMQRNWIGKSIGAEVTFKIKDAPDTLTVYTTRCDTLFGATYMVISPEHPLVTKLTTSDNKEKVECYIEEAKKKSDLERTDLNKNKTGVFTGSYAINPVNGEELPIWVSDYVLISYGTGSIMAVPAHDSRDFEFAKKFNLPIKEVLKSPNGVESAAWEEDGEHINSAFLNGLDKDEAIKKMLNYLEERGIGKKSVKYKLRDWLFSRQRYWGEPIPLVHCPKCGITPLPEESLPLLLPEVKSYEPTGTGESPLASITSWVNCNCPRCGGEAKRETNTMPQWAGSCWYYLRYLDPHNEKEFCSREKEQYWMSVDLYVGGVEHAVLHLLYARFWHKVLYDLGLVSTIEPFQRLINQGMITSFAYQRKNKTLVPSDLVEIRGDKYYERGTDNLLTQIVAKMSKSLKNVVNPDEEIAKYGADSVRMYEMFMGPLTLSKPWNTQGIIGIHRFLERVWEIKDKKFSTLTDKDIENRSDLVPLRLLFHSTIKKVSEDTETLNFNTAISAMMIFINDIARREEIPLYMWRAFVLVLSPYAPHIAEELWSLMGNKESLAFEKYPSYSAKYLTTSEKVIVVMINGKLRGKFTINETLEEDKLIERARAVESVKKYLTLEGKAVKVKKCITVKDKLVNFVL